MRALRSLAFGLAVLLTMLLLLLANLAMWAYPGLLEPAAVGRAVAATLDDRVLRDRVSRAAGESLAGAVADLGPLPGGVRRLLDLPPRPSESQLAGALTERIDGLLGSGPSGAAVAFATVAVSGLVAEVLDGTGATGDLARDGVWVDLTPVGRMVLDTIDPSGGLAGALPAGVVRVQLVDAGVMSALLPVARLVDMLRSLLPMACLVGVASILVLARFRVHALAWVGLCAVVAGTVSLLVASGSPVLIPRASALDAAAAAALTGVLDEVTAGLVTQSAVLAGLGLALVVAGIAGGVVVSRGDVSGHHARHGWDAGRLS